MTPNTKVVTRGTGVTANASHKHSHIKQYLKLGCALRVETVVNSPPIAARPSASSTSSRRPKGPTDASSSFSAPVRAVHQDRSLGADLTARVKGGRKNRSVSLRGPTRNGPRRWTPRGAQHRRRLLQQEPPCLGVPAPRQMTYDLRRLRLKGLVTRFERTDTYTLGDGGIGFAVTDTKLGHRVLPPARGRPQGSHEAASGLPRDRQPRKGVSGPRPSQNRSLRTCLKCEDGCNRGSLARRLWGRGGSI